MNIFLTVIVIFISLKVSTSFYHNQIRNKSEGNTIITNGDISYQPNDLFCDYISKQCKSEDGLVIETLTDLKVKFYKALWASLSDSARNKNYEILEFLKERNVRKGDSDCCEEMKSCKSDTHYEFADSAVENFAKFKERGEFKTFCDYIIKDYSNKIDELVDLMKNIINNNPKTKNKK